MSYFGAKRLVRNLSPGDVFYDSAASTYRQVVVAVEPDGGVVVVRAHPIRDPRSRLLWSEHREHYQIDAQVQIIEEPWQ